MRTRSSLPKRRNCRVAWPAAARLKPHSPMPTRLFSCGSTPPTNSEIPFPNQKASASCWPSQYPRRSPAYARSIGVSIQMDLRATHRALRPSHSPRAPARRPERSHLKTGRAADLEERVSATCYEARAITCRSRCPHEARERESTSGHHQSAHTYKPM